MKSNPSIIPPQGWHFPEEEGVIHGTGKKDLIAKVAKYRSDAGREVGNVEQEVDEYICKRWPHFCHGTKREIPAGAKVRHKPRLMDRVSQWTHRMTQKGALIKAQTDEVERRAEICITCPKNRPWEVCTTCADTNKAIRNRLTVITGDPDPVNIKLLGCACHGFDVNAAVQIENPLFEGQLSVGEEPRCWIKK